MTILSAPLPDYPVELEDYLAELKAIAKDRGVDAQETQKVQYDQLRSQKFRVGDKVMVLMPSDMQSKMRKLACPFHGPLEH